MKKNKMRLSSLIYELPRTLLKTGEEASKTQELSKNKQQNKKKDPKTWWCSHAQNLHDQERILEAEYQSSRNEITKNRIIIIKKQLVGIKKSFINARFNFT